jgi:hypothetical protein
LIFEDPTRKDSNKVRVTVSETRHYQLASPIDDLCIRKTRHDLVGRTNGRDQVVFDGNGGIEVNGWVPISSHDGAVVNDGGHGDLISTIGDGPAINAR